MAKVDNLTDDFIMGMDASCVPSLEASGVKYYDYDGTEKDVYEILSENGINYIRVRVWNDPYDSKGNGYGGGTTKIYSYVKINGEVVKTTDLTITVYNEWHAATISGINVAEGDVITVGIYVKCSSAGNGAWGKIDDAMLNSVKYFFMKGKKMKKILSLILVAIMFASVSLTTLTSCDLLGGLLKEPMLDPIDDNYRTFYQIFVGSFSDSDGDGTGDIRGIINRFDYLNDGNINSGKSLGVQGIWLSPIFTSPSYHKYDAIDYYEIDPKFGTMDDLKELVALCHSRNVKLILDLVINHTSTRHDWFEACKVARRNGNIDDKYYDYYTCVRSDEMVGGRTYQYLSGSYYYECNFSGDMPELNYDNPAVKEEMLNLAKYYLDMGIDGFRFDAIKYIYYGDTRESVAFWEWYMDELLRYKPDIYCVGECWSGETEILEYYSTMNCFNFAMSQSEGIAARAAKGYSIYAYTNYIDTYQDKILAVAPDGMVMNFLSNHDMDRIAGAFTLESDMRMAANLYLLTPGSPMIYYGEEIGMRGSRGGENTDANRRLAMLWGDGDTVRNPYGSTYKDEYQIKSSVKTQKRDEDSLYKYYCKLIAIRHKYPAIARGNYNAINFGNKNFGGFIIEYNGELLIMLHNTSSDEVTCDLSTCSSLAGKTSYELCDYIGTGEAYLGGGVITVPAQTTVILK